jgi:N-acetylglucosamine-6-phosphate deacetylase
MLAKCGVTAFLPTVSPAAGLDYAKVMESFKRMTLPSDAARMAGVHIEGPYVNPLRRGAIPAEAVRAVDMRELRHIVDAGEGLLKIMTIAPEIPGAAEAIEYLVKRGITPSMGHSAASYAEAGTAAAQGAARTTHTYNAMDPLHHREPGLLGFTMLDAGGYAELITDLRHVSAEACTLLLRAKGPGRVVAVSDALRHAGENLPDGTAVDGGIARGGVLRDETGTLCGSLRLLPDHLPGIVRTLGAGLPGAVRLLSVNCARSLGLRMGNITEGLPADLVIVDRNLTVRTVFLLSCPINCYTIR